MGSGFAKIFLAGEYAVLQGKMAVVAALDVRATARVVPHLPDAQEPTAVVKAVLDSEYHRMNPGTDISVDTTAFYDNLGRKFGIGSSSACLVSSLEAMLEQSANRVSLLSGSSPDWQRPSKTLARALELHRQAQCGLGSGADVLASALGGLIAVRGAPHATEVRRLPPTLPPFAILFSHAQAPTIPFLKAVQTLSVWEKNEFSRIISELGDIASSIVKIMDRGRIISILPLLAGIDASLAKLSPLLKKDVVTEQHFALKKRAENAGIVAKICGAGGGDVSLVLSEDGAALRQFVAENAAELGYSPLYVSIAPERDWLNG